MTTQLHVLKQELEHYDKDLLNKGRLVVANKMDAHCKASDGQEGSKMSMEFEQDLLRLQDSSGVPVMPISALLLWNITPLRKALFRMCNSRQPQ